MVCKLPYGISRSESKHACFCYCERDTKSLIVGLGLCNDMLTERSSSASSIGSVKLDSDKRRFSTGVMHPRTICGAQGPFMVQHKWSPRPIRAAGHLLRDRPYSVGEDTTNNLSHIM